MTQMQKFLVFLHFKSVLKAGRQRSGVLHIFSFIAQWFSNTSRSSRSLQNATNLRDLSDQKGLRSQTLISFKLPILLSVLSFGFVKIASK